MDEEELADIISEGESQEVEFRERAGKLGRDLAAFANAQGGMIVLGVNDQNEVVGLPNLNKERGDIHDANRDCSPPVPIEEVEKVSECLIVHVDEGKTSHRAPGGYYLRKGASSQKLTDNEEIQDLWKRKGDIKFGNTVNDAFEYPDDFDEDELNRYLSISALDREGLSTSDLLVNWGIAEKRDETIALKNAAILMFGKNPHDSFHKPM